MGDLTRARALTMQSRARRPAPALVLSVLVVLLAASLLFAAAFGAVSLRPDDLIRMTLNHVIGSNFSSGRKLTAVSLPWSRAR